MIFDPCACSGAEHVCASFSVSVFGCSFRESERRSLIWRQDYQQARRTRLKFPLTEACETEFFPCLSYRSPKVLLFSQQHDIININLQPLGEKRMATRLQRRKCLKELRDKYDVTYETIAKLLEKKPGTVQAWLSNSGVDIPANSLELLELKLKQEFPTI